MTELHILQKMKNHDPTGLEALMNRYTPYVSAVVWGILRASMSAEDAEEVASDVFLTAWEQASDLHVGHVKSWLAAVARNKAKNKLRERGETLPLEDDLLEIQGLDDPEQDVEQNELARLVRAAVDSLPNEDREIFIRHYFYGQTIREIADASQLNENSIKSKLRRGRIKLKSILTNDGEGAFHETQHF